MPKARIDKARKRENEYYIAVTVFSDDFKTAMGAEEFRFGLATPVPAMRTEILNTIRSRYGSHPEEILLFEGQVIDF